MRRCSRAPRRTTSSRSTSRGARTSSGPSRRAASPSTSCATRCDTCRSGTRSTSARTTSRKRVRRRSRRSRTRWRPRSTCSTQCASRARSTRDEFPEVVGRISFFVNAGIRFVEEMCKLRAFAALWDRITAERYGVTDEKLRRFRYGVQVNSLGLTEAQPENNVQRIVLETLGVTLSKDARARAVQLPAWNEALGLPAPVGPAVVAADPTGARLRDRPARVRRPVRRLTRGRAQDRRDRRGGRGRTAVGARRRRRLRHDRRDEAAAGAEQRRAGASHRGG